VYNNNKTAFYAILLREKVGAGGLQLNANVFKAVTSRFINPLPKWIILQYSTEITQISAEQFSCF